MSCLAVLSIRAFITLRTSGSVRAAATTAAKPVTTSPSSSRPTRSSRATWTTRSAFASRSAKIESAVLFRSTILQRQGPATASPPSGRADSTFVTRTAGVSIPATAFTINQPLNCVGTPLACGSLRSLRPLRSVSSVLSRQENTDRTRDRIIDRQANTSGVRTRLAGGCFGVFGCEGLNSGIVGELRFERVNNEVIAIGNDPRAAQESKGVARDCNGAVLTNVSY